MLGVFAEFETNLRRERQLEGIAKAKVAGVYKGRKPSIDVALAGPSIKGLQAASCESLRAIAAGLEERGIPAALTSRELIANLWCCFGAYSS
jgi:DNA invertase Pin-like site-specific DNA recombinase